MGNDYWQRFLNHLHFFEKKWTEADLLNSTMTQVIVFEIIYNTALMWGVQKKNS